MWLAQLLAGLPPIPIDILLNMDEIYHVDIGVSPSWVRWL